jgi:hypothetical protein
MDFVRSFVKMTKAVFIYKWRYMFKNTGRFSKGESVGKEPVTVAKMHEVRSAFVLSPIVSTRQAVGYWSVAQTDSAEERCKAVET